MSNPLVEDEALSRRERERQMRRQAMLNAAQAVFAEKGYAQATLDEIAERAEFGKGTLYNYFEGGKEEILFATFETLFGEIQRLADEVLSTENTEGRPLRDIFHELVIAGFRFFLERKDLYFILMKEEMQFMFGDDPEKAAFFRQRQRSMNEVLIPPLEAAVEAGEIKPLPLRAVASTLQGNIRGILTHVVMMHRSPTGPCEEAAITTPEEAADFLTTMLFDGLLTTLPSPSSPAS